MKLSGKTVLVTGSSQGIGQGVAIRLAEEGADVVVNYRSHLEGAEQTVSTIKALGRRAVAIHADLGSRSEMEKLFAEAVKHLGTVDVLVNNAGLEKRAAFWEVTEEDYDQVQAVNMRAVFFLTQEAVKYWKSHQRAGKVINISSVHEEMAFPGFAPYVVSKGGLRMFTRSLAVELGPLGITINNVAPGAIATPINREVLDDAGKRAALLQQIPLGRIGEPADVGGAVAYLASADADYITGSTLVIDGGLMRNYHE